MGVEFFEQSVIWSAQMSLKKVTILIPVLLAVGSAGIALAQTSPPATTDKPPLAGANSFTEAQAKAQIEKAGFTQVTGLRKDDQGIWRGSAMQGGKQLTVSLDFRGNVTSP